MTPVPDSDQSNVAVSGLCTRCGQRKATMDWVGEGGMLAWSHGMSVRWCNVCALEAQIEHARDVAAKLPDLERELREARGEVPTMALRPDSEFPDEMDDIVVNDVTMFRAEAMADDVWWMACYFANGERVSFHVGIASKPKRIVVSVTEEPPEWVDWDKQRRTSVETDETQQPREDGPNGR